MAELKIINMETVESRKVKWLWYPYIPYGKITNVNGDPGDGKTTLVRRLAALLSNGDPLPGETEAREPISILYQTAEDGLNDTIKPRLEEAKADCSNIKVIDETAVPLNMLDSRVEQAIIQTGAKLVIFDPIQAYIGASVDMNRANEVRPVLARLGVLAEKYGCAIVLVGHISKAQGAKAGYRVLGSIDFQAAARSVLLVGRIKDNPTVRVMAQGKSNLAPEGPAIAFELNKDTGFSWLGLYEISVEDLLAGGSRENKLEAAERLLECELASGKVSQRALLGKAKATGISKRVLDQAKKNLGVQSIKQADCWLWELPNDSEACNIADY